MSHSVRNFLCMRILHTSDWHLGRRLAEHRLLDDQASFVDWLVELTRSERIEAVLVAGDLFDRSVPGADAWELLWTAFRRLVDAGAQVVAIAGNHDSAERIGAVHGVTESSGVYLRGGFGQAGRVDVLDLPGGPLAVAALPYLDPRMCPPGFADPEDGNELPDDDGSGPGPARQSHEVLLGRAACRALGAMPEGVPRLGLAHAFVTGATPSGSERDLAVGDAAMVSSAVFDGFDYVALGHLHTPQQVRAIAEVRYSGSPLAYSFGETAPKEVEVVELQHGAPVKVEPIGIEVGRRVLTVRSTLENLAARPPVTDRWVRAELTDDQRPLDAARRLRRAFPGLAEVAWVGARTAGVSDHPTPERAEPRSPIEVVGDFWLESTGAGLSDEEAALIGEALDPPADLAARAGAGEAA